jgi:hypothetical protein
MSPDSKALFIRATDDSISTATESSGWVRLCCTERERKNSEERYSQYQGSHKF